MDVDVPLPLTDDALPVADEWWQVEEVNAGVFRLWEPAVHPLIRASAVPTTVVLGGHGEPFGRMRMLELIDAYLGQASTNEGEA